MKNLILIIAALFVFSATGTTQITDIFKKVDKVLGKEGDLDVSGGLKQALEFGVTEAVDQLSIENGYFESPYKILLPEEAVKVIKKLKAVPGFQNLERDLVLKMNQAAELAAKKATPIFVDAITGLTIDDAMNILMGENDAATQYLEGSTRKQLYTAFLPIIQNSLDEVNAREIWTPAVETYNSLPFVKKINPQLDDHVNNKGLDGLFGLIQVKEEKIRGDQNERTTDLLRNVFAKQDKS